MTFNLAEAKKMDQEDSLKKYRKEFYFPTLEEKTPYIYFCGNSLGLQPKKAKQNLEKELKHWAKYGVEGHVEGDSAWLYYHHKFTKSASKLVGAKITEVVMMNTLTVNLHMLMLSFYKPTAKKNKIIIEGGAFPSDQYAMESQAQLHGLKAKDVVIELHPRKGEYALRTEDILKKIEEHKNGLSIVMLGAVNYYTGQYYDLKKITEAGHKAGAKVGFDLAHAAGNVPLKLHDWEVDFACWCTYKYLNSGPGSVSGAYIHEKHATNPKTFRLAGWWGYDEKKRFLMESGFNPMPNAQSWQMSNAPVFNMAIHRASLDLFDEVGMNALRKKSLKLTQYLYDLLSDCSHLKFTIITPQNKEERGAQLSLLFHENGKNIFDELQKNKIIVDWREPNVIRISPVPMYNSFEDVFKLYQVLKKIK